MLLARAHGDQESRVAGDRRGDLARAEFLEAQRRVLTGRSRGHGVVVG